MSTPLPSLFRRIFTKPTLNPIVVQDGKNAALEDAKSNKLTPNPHSKATIEYKSWKKGYESADDSVYVW
jgi:outer membrane lipoprotein-sorting protein